MNNFQARLAGALALACATLSFVATAHQGEPESSRPDGHAPIGVMGDHTHSRGQVMLSYRFSAMRMQGNQIGSSDVNPEYIASNVPNRFSAMPGQPPTLRVVPLRMDMQMHMLGAMWAPNNRVTIMAMLPYVRKTMDHVTFQGGMGSNRLGEFTTRAEGLGDASLTAMIPVWGDGRQRLHVNAGLALPTGSTTRAGRVLAPNGMQPTLRLPYPMQPGSGSYSLLPALTWAGHDGRWSWGAQYKARVRLDTNDEGYQLGDKHHLTTWGGWRASQKLSLSMRTEYENEGAVRGRDAAVVAPVQTADPDFQGGERIAGWLGSNWKLGASGARLAIELGGTVYQDLHGPQLERGPGIRIGYQHSIR